MKAETAGIGKKGRRSLAALLKARLSVITPKDSAAVLGVSQSKAAQLLAHWARTGWLSRIKHGVYVPVSLQSEHNNIPPDEPWVVANALFSPCYIGGWSAAEYWNLTEQIFQTTMVLSTTKSASRDVVLKGARFRIKTIKPERLFGYKKVWIGIEKVPVSDATRTIVDAFNDPAVVGGIRMAVDILEAYMNSEHKDLNQLFEYALRMKNSAIFKRLGFVFSQIYGEEVEFIQRAKKEIKPGYSQLDPSVPGETLITKWRLWVAESWKKGSYPT